MFVSGARGTEQGTRSVSGGASTPVAAAEALAAAGPSSAAIRSFLGRWFRWERLIRGLQKAPSGFAPPVTPTTCKQSVAKPAADVRRAVAPPANWQGAPLHSERASALLLPSGPRNRWNKEHGHSLLRVRWVAPGRAGSLSGAIPGASSGQIVFLYGFYIVARGLIVVHRTRPVYTYVLFGLIALLVEGGGYYAMQRAAERMQTESGQSVPAARE